ncbi:H(+)-transporting V1 sector ATPase subunit H, partial [Dimargaris xerosporica]
LQSENPNVVDVTVQVLQGLLKLDSFRQVFYHHTQTMNVVIKLVRANFTSNPQMTYQLVFCLWLLSFDEEVCASINKRYDLIALLMDVAKNSAKEKIIRMVMATLKNLLVQAPQVNTPGMIVLKLPTFCDNLATRKWTDDDIKDDVDYIREDLTERLQKLSTWDEYVSELESGHLSWTPAHQSDAFWKLHAAKLADDHGKLFKLLVDILNTSSDATVLAIAAHDVGEFAKHYSSGKKMVQQLGAKEKVMELMTHHNPDVKYQALVAVQTLMSHAWDQ